MSNSREFSPDGIPPRCVTFVMKYCSTCWRNARLHGDNWPDATQEVVEILLEERLGSVGAAWAAMTDNPGGDERAELVRAVDRVKKRYLRARRHEAIVLPIPDDTDRVERERGALWAAVEHLLNGLSAIQQTIVRLTREGWSVPDIAAQVGKSRDIVSDEKYKALKKLRQMLGTPA